MMEQYVIQEAVFPLPHWSSSMETIHQTLLNKKNNGEKYAHIRSQKQIKKTEYF